MAYDIQVLVQAIIYFFIFLLGFVVSIPLGVTVVEFDGNCILYTEFDWKNETYATYEFSSRAVCNFPVYFAVFVCIFYGLVMGIYNMYAVCKSQDPNIGFQMWLMPFLLLNSLIAVVMFVACCVISVGMKSTCDSLEKGANIHSCSDGTKINWNLDIGGKHTKYTYSHFYSYPKVSETAGWITFLAWLCQVALCMVRFIRNRRMRSKGMIDETPPTTNKTSDMENFASVHPSA